MLPILSIIGKKAHNIFSIFPVCFYFLYKVNMILSKSRSDLRKFPSIFSALYSHGMQLYQSKNTSTFSSGMSRFDSAGNAKLLVLPVTFSFIGN